MKFQPRLVKPFFEGACEKINTMLAISFRFRKNSSLTLIDFYKIGWQWFQPKLCVMRNLLQRGRGYTSKRWLDTQAIAKQNVIPFSFWIWAFTLSSCSCDFHFYYIGTVNVIIATTTTISLIPLGEIGYMDHTTPSSVVGNQIFKNIMLLLQQNLIKRFAQRPHPSIHTTKLDKQVMSVQELHLHRS